VPRSSSGIVAGLTAAALAAVGFLAYQASASAPDTLGKPQTPSTSHSVSGAPAKKKDQFPVPARSGTGKRVVYALHDRRVWLVGPTGARMRTFPVMPSTVNPPPGSYAVTTRAPQIPGSDGVSVEHVVRFATVDGVTIGFSAALDGSMPSPDPKLKTGGVRMSRVDGDALWSFADVGAKIVVVQ
jgi:hypothetical protein